MFGRKHKKIKREWEADLADVTLRHLRKRGGERNPLVLTSELVSRVNLLVAGPAERRFVGAAQNVGLRGLTDVALNLHHSEFSPQ